MFTRIKNAIPAVIFLSSLSASHPVYAQSYHHVVTHIEAPIGAGSIEAPDGADSVEAPHLQISIRQPDKKNLRFRVAVLNPDGHKMQVRIMKDEDMLFYENARGSLYYNTFNFGQLEDGDYKFIIIGGKERIVKSIHLQTTDSSYRQVSIR